MDGESNCVVVVSIHHDGREHEVRLAAEDGSAIWIKPQLGDGEAYFELADLAEALARLGVDLADYREPVWGPQ